MNPGIPIKLKLMRASIVFAVLGVTLFVLKVGPVPTATTIDALPNVATPFDGDPRLEKIPKNPMRLVNFPVSANIRDENGVFSPGIVTMRFPPRVNGQNMSNGDLHADLYLLFDAATGTPINQPPILEAVPKRAAGGDVDVEDSTAFQFSPIWELHAVTVDSSYDPTDDDELIDSELKVFTSEKVQKIFQTNIFLNCPVVPLGSTVEGNTHPVEKAFWNEHIVNIVPYDIEDGGFNAQILFKFEDQLGNVLPTPTNPHLVASHSPGEPFYSSIWELWTVVVPPGEEANISNIMTKADVNKKLATVGWRVKSSGIRLDCPAVAVNGVPIPLEDFRALIEDQNGRFNPAAFPKDLPDGQFTKRRTFLITEITPGGVGLVPPAIPPAIGTLPIINTTGLPIIDPEGKGNVIPLILKDPFQEDSSAPNAAGPIVRIDQAALDAAYNNGDDPKLPKAIEENFNDLIAAGLLDPEWAAGGKSYQKRLALVGRALFELNWTPEQGAHSNDVSACIACHSGPSSGGAARGLYTLDASNPLRPDFGVVTHLNAGSMFGSGGAELLNAQMKAALGADAGTITFAHGSQGQIASMRATVAGANNAHMGIQATESLITNAAAIAKCGSPGETKLTVAEAAKCDLDGDGVVNEISVGEVTAETEFLLALKNPEQADDETFDILGISESSVDNGKRLFESSIDLQGTSCASCHTPFLKFATNDRPIFMLPNPQTSSVFPIKVDHTRLKDGTRGLQLYGDFRKHKMGARMLSNASDTSKTAELWDVGSVYPSFKDGSAGSNLMDAILRHGGVELSGVSVARSAQTNFTNAAGENLSSQVITITNQSTSTIDLSTTVPAGSRPGQLPPSPLRVVLVGAITPGVTADNASAPGPAGSLRQGAVWIIPNPVDNSLAPGASVQIELIFKNPSGLPLEYDLLVQDNVGYSEGAASARAFGFLSALLQQDIVNFLRVQLIDEKFGEGSGGN